MRSERRASRSSCRAAVCRGRTPGARCRPLSRRPGFRPTRARGARRRARRPPLLLPDDAQRRVPRGGSDHHPRHRHELCDRPRFAAPLQRLRQDRAHRYRPSGDGRLRRSRHSLCSTSTRPNAAMQESTIAASRRRSGIRFGNRLADATSCSMMRLVSAGWRSMSAASTFAPSRPENPRRACGQE